MHNKEHFKVATITGLALFAMFFGAGNLIFPVMIGVQAGSSQLAATLGFLVTGVLLPMLAMIAAATSSSGVLGIAERISHYPGLMFCWMIFLSTGVLYAIPRTATVSYSMSIEPLIGAGSGWGLLIYALVFFAIAGVMVLNPSNLLDKIGGWLTPVLLLLLIILILSSLCMMHPSSGLPEETYQDPVITGLLQGYNTLDAIASFVFGVVIISSLRRQGYQPGRPLFSMTALSGVIAAVFLGLIYFGLSLLGNRVANQKPNVANGAEGLVFATSYMFGTVGSVILATIAILACLTTAIGLFGASIQFFRGLFPQLSRAQWLAIHLLISLIIANLGLDILLKVVVPIMYFCYPIAICLIFTCLLDIFIPGHMFWAYRASVWTAAFFGLIDALRQAIQLFELHTQPGWPAGFVWLVEKYVPMSNRSLGWVVPAVLMFVLGFVLDLCQGRMRQKLDYDQVARQRNRQLIDSGLLDGASEEQHSTGQNDTARSSSASPGKVD